MTTHKKPRRAAKEVRRLVEQSRRAAMDLQRKLFDLFVTEVRAGAPAIHFESWTSKFYIRWTIGDEEIRVSNPTSLKSVCVNHYQWACTDLDELFKAILDVVGGVYDDEDEDDIDDEDEDDEDDE